MTLKPETIRVYEYVNRKLPHIRRLRRVKLNESDQRFVINTLNELAGFCLLGPNKAHRMNQVGIIYIYIYTYIYIVENTHNLTPGNVDVVNIRLLEK